MSQKKVDAYKARKGLHNKTDRKEKVLFGLEMFAWAFICVVIVAWIGYSAYVKVTGAKENVVQNTVMDTTALDNYISNLSTDASDGTDSTDADTAEEEDTTASTDTDSEDADAADTTADDSETETADKSEEADDTNVADDKAAETADSTTDTDSADANKYIAENQFAAGSMLPKIEAAVSFASKGSGHRTIITDIAHARDGYREKTGTIIK